MTGHENAKLIEITRSEGEGKAPQDVDLGARVRELRKSKNWTLEQAAQKAGLARSTLSKIENEQMSPTFEAVKKLATGLGISVPQLFTAPASDRVMARLSVTQSGEGKPFVTETYEHEILASKLSQKAILPYRTRVRARDIEEFNGWVRHDGEEFLYVLTGVVQVFTEFYEPVELRRGDSVYYDATMGHNVISLSDEDATILWITTLT